MMRSNSVLLVDSRPTDAEFIRVLLESTPDGEFTIEHVGALRDAIAVVHQRQFDIVVLDPSLPDSVGPNAIRRLRATAPELPLVVLTGQKDDDLALEAIRLGAQDYLSKEHVIGHLLARVIRHSIARQHQLRIAQTQALTDSLTGIGNRRAFDLELTRRLIEFRRYGAGCCVMLLDLDHFKAVNDRYGHDTGDEVLQGIAGVLRRTLRETDLAARYGGEEFGVILPRTPVTEAYEVAECLRQTVAHAEWSIQCDALRVTTSAGLAEARPADDESSLLRRADKSLYAAKRTGRNRCCWTEGEFSSIGFDIRRRVREQPC